MPIFADRVQETVSGTPGTGAITFGGAVSGFQTFAAGFPSKPVVIGYVIEDGTNWEVGMGTLNSSGTQLTRDKIRSSSNSGSAINASSSAKVFCTPSAEFFDNANIGQVLAQSRGWAMP